MEIYSIGYAQRSAQDFFDALIQAGIEQLVDVRLRNVSQLAGFTKKEDLHYFLRKLVGASYRHETLLAPLPELLTAYRKKKLNWEEYEERFMVLLACRQVEKRISKESFSAPTVLLCSERGPERCHRRLVLEYLQEKWHIDWTVIHL